MSVNKAEILKKMQAQLKSASAITKQLNQECQTADGTPFRLVAAPVQYDEEPAKPARAPKFNEHGDAILGDLGLDWDAIIDLKVRGVVA